MSQDTANISTVAADGKAPLSKVKANKGKVNTPARKVANTARNQQQGREVVTFETARRACPCEAVATKIVNRFALQAVDYHDIREKTEEALARSGAVLANVLNEKALEMHMQRIVDGFVRSAHGAGNFYDKKAALARELSSAVANADRDEDRFGIDGQANRAERACGFAAVVGLQAYALLAAAEGAVDAYAHVCGSDWKPYEGMGGASLSRQALSAQVDAFTA